MDEYRRATYLDLFKQIKSGIGIDAAVLHTGVCIWNGTDVETYGFKYGDYDKNDQFAEYRMRREFKNKLKEIVDGRHFEICVIEDCYAGKNIDTFRKLVALNTVIDELLFEGTCSCEVFHRWREPTWMSKFRMVYKQRGFLKSKVETQGILEYLQYPFYLNNKDKSNAEKEKIYFEDICDATGMLIGAIADKIFQINSAKPSTLRMSDIRMYYIDDLDNPFLIKDKKVEEGWIGVELDTRNLEKSILSQCSAYPDDVLCAIVPPSKLGVFGVKHKFTFYDTDEAYLIFYRKPKKDEKTIQV